jgi:sigma-B regulation protein RsbU (phosphoserine phosphatase)
VKRKRWTVAQWVAAAIVLVVALGAWRLTVAAGHASARTARWQTVAGGVQADIAVGHVWLEEYIAGDRSIRVNRDVFGNFDNARERCRALLDGGLSPDGGSVAPVDDRQLRGELVAQCRGLDGLRALTVQRVRRLTPAGSSADQRYDARFRQLLALAERLPRRIRDLSGQDEDRLKLIETGAIILLGAALLLAVGVIRAAQRQVERLARERQSVLESAGEGILAIDADGHIRFANATAGVILGWPSRELTGRQVAELIPQDAGDLPAGRLELGPGGGTAGLQRRDGARLAIEYTATAAEVEGTRKTIVLTFRDVTARRLLEREREAELAELRAMRATLVPADLPRLADLRMGTCFVPAMSGVSGDFYLVTEGPGDTTVVVVGDVSGKGVAAAQCAAFVRTALATFAPYTPSPCRLLELANRSLRERGLDFEMLVTAACAVVEPAAQAITWSLAGHPPPLRLDGGTPVSVKPGLPLGLEPEVGAQDAREPLRPGDGFVVFTDGLYEARAAAPGAGGAQVEHFGLPRIGELVAALPGAEPDDVVQALREAAEAFTEGLLTDDLCILAFRAQPVASPRLPIRPSRGADRARRSSGRRSGASRERDRPDTPLSG